MDQDMALEMLPASPYMRQQRSRRRRPDADSMPHYLSYTHSECSRERTQLGPLLHLCIAPPLPHILPFTAPQGLHAERSREGRADVY